jgi:tryptophanyl-tRNA synthetase
MASLDTPESDSLRACLTRSAELDALIRTEPARFKVLTGDRPTGRLHLGHYFGTLASRLKLQRAGAEMFVLIADYQVLTDRDVAERLPEYVNGLIADYLAIGIDPASTTIFAHSAVPALNQLMLPFLSLVSVTELERNPTVKEEIKLSRQSGISGLMLTYPVHQAADILFCKANLVPVGKDQLPHVQMARVIARRFNDRYAELFPVPDALLSAAPNVLGTDGQKMSKSQANSIALGDSADETARLVKRAKTDEIRHIGYDPVRRPEVSSLLLIAALCQDRDPGEVAEEIGGRGSAELKRVVTESVNEFLRPVRARRAALLADPGYLGSVLAAGNSVANAIANRTMTEVTAAMGAKYEVRQ